MKAKYKFGSGIIAGFLALVIAMTIFIGLPIVSNAETGTLGTESPEIYCTFSQDGELVDGNELTAGTYDVSFVISGVKNLAVVQITATYDDSMVTVASAPSYSISDDEAFPFHTIGYKNENSTIITGFISGNDDCTAISSDGQVLTTISMTFASDCDAADYITADQDPNHTFVQVDLNDSTSDQYALVDSYPGYSGNLYPMSCDVTPVITAEYTVNGQVLIATDTTGTNTTAGIIGITVTVEKDGLIIAQAVTDENGFYTLPDIPVGEYTITFSGSTTVDRAGTLTVSSDKAVDSVVTLDSVGIVICDYNKDGAFNAIDVAVFSGSFSGEYNVYCDLNADKGVNAIDAAVFSGIFGKTVAYDDLTL
ncbi:MAG TPA: hypothetical protein IAA24_00300 [Candidatus Eubacterium faecigallinarum]|nr:hypothetical protein [Candidatus Eubacterium faecigallinarum]